MALIALSAALVVPQLAAAAPTDSVVQNTASVMQLTWYKQTETGDVAVRSGSGPIAAGCAFEAIVAKDHPLFAGLTRAKANAVATCENSSRHEDGVGH